MNKSQEVKAVFLITIDALRKDHLKSYGYHRNPAPNLENLVQSGTLFSNAITNGPATPSSFSAIFTSILPYLEGGYSPLPSQKIIFPQILNENGIFNYAIHSNPNLGKFFNYGRGFDVFLDEQKNIIKTQNTDSSNIKRIISKSIKKILNKELVRKLLYNIPGFNRIKNWLRKRILIFTDLLLPFIPLGFNAPYIVNKVSNFLKNHRGPLFLWAHFMDVHRPYNPPKENVLKFRESDFSRSERKFLTMELHMISNRQKISPTHIKNLKVLYDAEINFVDDSLYSLFKIIEEKFKDNCLIIITSDHGESFNDHHTFGHQGSVYEELIKVPFFLIELGRKQAVKKVEEAVQLIDIPPTILDYFNINIPEDFQGKSLLPLLNGDSLNRKKPVITECYQKGGFMKRNNTEGYILISIRTDTWKYIYDEENDQEFLFNLINDPKEKSNLVSKNKNKLEEFRLIKQHHLSRVAKPTEKTKLAQAIRKIELS